MKQIYPGIFTWEMLNDICKHDTYVLVFIDNDAGRYGQWQWLSWTLINNANYGKQLWMFIMNKAYSGNYIRIIPLIFIHEGTPDKKWAIIIGGGCHVDIGTYSLCIEP